MNRNLVIFSIVVSFLSVVFMFLQYYGITRFCQLHFCSSESYVSDYKKIPRADYKGKIIISISPKNNDLSKLKPFLNSILDQTCHVDQIALNLSDQSEFIIPDFIKNTDFVTIYKTPNKVTYANKIIAPLLREKNGDTLILCLDDQMIYGKDFIESIVAEANKTPNNAISGKVNGKIIDCKHGVAVKPTFFTSDVIDTSKGPKDQCMDVDMWLTAQLARKNTKINNMDYRDNMKKLKYENQEVDHNLRNRLASFYAAYL